MVKKLLSLSIAVLVSIVSVQAQGLQRDPARHLFNRNMHAAKAPAKVASLEGTTAWGYTESMDWGGLGVGSTGVVFDVAIFVPGDGALKGTTIQGVNLPVVDAGMSNVSVWVRKSLTGANLASATTDGPFLVNSYTAVPFDEPVALPEAGVYVGCTFTNSTAYAIPYDYYGSSVANALFLQWDNGGWGDYSDQFPPSPMQAFLSGFEMPDYSVSIASVGTAVQMPNQTYSLPVTLSSTSANQITSVDVDVTLNGNTESKHVNLKTPIASGFNQAGTFYVEGTSPATVGEYFITVKVTKLNDIPYEGEATGRGSVKNLSKLVQRHTVVEEFTGTGCGWCTRGWSGMEYMKATYPETFIGIAFHKYNNTDPMYYANYPMLGMSGAPSCIVDRKEIMDPYYGNVNDVLGIAYDFERLNNEPAEVDVNVTAQWNDAQSIATINSNVEFLIKPAGSVSVIYVLTADSLSGTTTAWKQANYYPSYYTKEQMSDSPILMEFGSNGKYGTNPVGLIFNDVVIGSSYNTNGANIGQNVDGEDYDAGSVFEGSYKITQPSKATLKNALHKDLITAAVLVVDDETGFILNAAKTRVAMPDAIVDVIPTTANGLSTRYNMAGQVITTPQRGVNIIKMADGSVRKVMVK